MFSHVHVGARDLECLVVFYDALLAKLGLIQMPEGNGGAARGVGWRYPNRRFIVGAVGSYVGARITSRFVPSAKIKQIFGVLIVLMTLYKIYTMVK